MYCCKTRMEMGLGPKEGICKVFCWKDAEIGLEERGLLVEVLLVEEYWVFRAAWLSAVYCSKFLFTKFSSYEKNESKFKSNSLKKSKKPLQTKYIR